MQTLTKLEAFQSTIKLLLKFSKSRGSYWSLLLIWTYGIYFSSHLAIKAVIASLMLLSDPQISQLLAVPTPQVIEIKRLVHQHYLSYSIYIPLDDIVIYDQRRVEQPLTALLQQSCGSGSAYVWVPLKMQLPLMGEKVWEWCLIKT